MANPWFRFKEFTIRQDRCAMKVGTDGVLLGAWADIEQARHILDIGTGSGLIAIMAAQRNSLAQIDAIEIDLSACDQARENVALCRWNERIHVFKGEVQQFQPGKLYDTILCNPPFFIRSTPNPEPTRNQARHCETLSYPDLLTAANRLLADKGSLQLILPVNEAKLFIGMATDEKWFINKITRVYPTPEKPEKRCLLSLSHIETERQEDYLIIETERHIYHETFKQLTKDYYLDK